MRNPRNQLIIAMVFALVLGLIIVVAARCGARGQPMTTAARTPTAKLTGSPVRGTVTVIPGRATDVAILPPGGQPTASPTPIVAGPLPVVTPQPAAASPTPVTVGPATISQPQPQPQAAATATPVTVASGGTVHVVKAGETLSGIARMYGTTVTAIAQANNITNPSRIYTGQRLRIPAPSATATATGGRVYIVQRGDNLSRIAARFGTTVDAIVRANNLRNPSLIYAGQRLIIP